MHGTQYISITDKTQMHRFPKGLHYNAVHQGDMIQDTDLTNNIIDAVVK